MLPDLRPLPFERAKNTRRLAFVAVLAAVGAASINVAGQASSPIAALGASTLAAAVVVATFVVPWGHLPSPLQLALSAAYFVVVLLLREAQGVGQSGVAAMMLLPVVLIALYGRRRDFALSLIAVAIALAAPILVIGEPNYPSSEWRRLVMITAVAAVVGLTVENFASTTRRRTLTDALTGLPNRRAMGERLALEMEMARRTGAPLSLVFMDIDHFKDFNDSRGHLAGDRYLVDAATAWQGCLRASDLLARIGGEEFVVVLPRCGPDEALATTERIRITSPIGTTSSLGVATWTGLESSADLLQRADAALYAAKRAGRDRVVQATHAPHSGQLDGASVAARS